MNGYSLTRTFFDWTFENLEKVTPTHVALYCWLVELNNRMGWKKNFSAPAGYCMEAIGVKSYNTFHKTFLDLIEWGFIEVVQKSRNQYTANIIALSNFDKANDKALDKALAGHVTKQSESTCKSTCDIDKQETNKPKTNKTESNILMSELSASDLIYEKIAFSFWELFKNKMSEYGINSTDHNESKSKKWVNAVRLMMESDKRTEEEVREVFKYLKAEIPQKSGFAWSKNVRSTESLRKHFVDLLLAARNKPAGRFGKTIPDDYKKQVLEEALGIAPSLEYTDGERLKMTRFQYDNK